MIPGSKVTSEFGDPAPVSRRGAAQAPGGLPPPHKQQLVREEEHQDPERNPGSRDEEGAECSAATMAPVFVLLQEVEEMRGGGRPRGPGTVGTTGSPATAAEGLPRRRAAFPSRGDRSSCAQTGWWMFYVSGESGG